ncbi:fibrinogen-like YCDxxxxGGGW domain-containing protein [Microbacterium sp. M28]|uniref:fibrinogen-like YCDxxxxGGGW domain-containing protein n=1 Tax=Microbacterium sp. M28 TaxID=2962064 RepID=UPI0021F4E2B7|nr:fibrinogen-like YCDxxxxGGGW domain-containing protein [Microbacterium sp. M28]UYO96651.1 fibrinogen-like YCDxxxxGGGW domain-containing protein [Microbacterium sp. M28]
MMNTNSTPRRSRIARSTATAAVVVAAMIGALFSPLPATSAATPLPDGLTQETAAASCWEIKQNHPASSDGIYWLVTPKLGAPDQFYCDQTTNGGGWVLVGRGREAWKEGYNGLRTPEQLRNTPTGTGAFQPAQLPSTTIDGLLNGSRVDALPDGIRLRRATNTTGSQWQEARFKLSKRDRWVWTFGAEHRVQSYSFDGAGGTGGQTNNFGSNNQLRRVVFNEQATHNYLNGWAFGSSTGGSTADDSFVWSPSGRGYARPFTQVYLRPQLALADLDFGAVPASGTAATTVAAVPESDAMNTSWGVSGFANGSSGELNTEIAEFGEVDGKVYAGGNFKFVQRTEGGADQVQQSYIAAFDVNTGQWVPTFRPVLNGQVKAIAGLPDGRIAIGGQFSTVNGTAQAAIAFLDPDTGQLSGAQVAAEQRTTGGVPYVRDLDVQGGYLYVAGSLTHLTAVGASTSASAWNGGRVTLATSRPDTNWNAFLNGTSIAVDASAQGDRAYFSGYFKMKQTSSTPSAAAIQTAPGAPVVSPLWVPTFSKSSTDASGNITGNVWQLGVTESGGRVWLGGSEHSLFAYDRDTFALERGSITKAGGDFQTVDDNGSLVIAGCHCGHWVYQDAYTWSDVGSGWNQADKINLVGAWDAASGSYLPEWSPVVQARAGYGAWGTFFDSTGVLWVGGDFSRSVRAGEVGQWSGGYIRFAPRDATAPSAPGAITATPGNGGTEATLTWGASTDAGGVTYEIIRGNRVIASTPTATYTVPVTEEPTNYFVRARDSEGNRSASTTAFVVEPAPESALTLIENGATWAWRYSSDALPSNWATAAFDDSSWSTGQGLFGRGVAAATTNIDPTNLATKPLSAQFRTEFEVEDALSVVNGSISLIANDGAVVYLNGTELGRVRMPSGTVSQNSYASSVVTHTAAAANRIVFEVPAGVLVDGTNLLAASIHANYRSTPDLSFDLAFTAERGEAPTAPAAVGGLTAVTTTDAATLTWTAPASGTAPQSYVVHRDGQEIGTTDAATLTFADTGLAPETSYEYSVTAVAFGTLTSPAATVTATTKALPTEDELPVVIENGATWSWRYSADPLPADWNAPSFDDSAWASGPGLFARGVAAAATNIDPTPLATKPLSAQFRHAFVVEEAAGVLDGTVTVIADDGVVVYLNGTELGRANLPAGTLTQNSYASAAPRATTAAANRLTFTVPATLLVDGENVLSASVHANYRSTPDLSFDLALSMLRG